MKKEYNKKFIMNSIYNHRSIRKFTAKQIEEEKLQAIYNAISRASNTGNMQWYSVVVTTSEEIKDRLCTEAHFNQQMVKSAPLVLTFCADINRFNKWCSQRNAAPGYDNFLSLYTATIDATIAAQNACIAAEEQDLGICYLGTTNYNAQKIIDILALPKFVLPVTTVVVGYADESPELTERLPLEAIIHNETYTDYTEEKIDALYEGKEALKENISFVKENNTENLAQIFTNIRYTKTNNIVFSQSLLDTLKKQGFMNNE